MDDSDGYTLTEMLVVIGIIGLIAATLTPTLANQLGRARFKTAQLQLQTVSAALEQYRSDIGHYPSAAEGLQVLYAQPPDATGWTGPYVKQLKSLSDPWGHPIQYTVDNTGDHARVTSLGSDGKVGGTGTAGDIHDP